MPSARSNQNIRYELDERCPPALAIGVGIQGILIVLPPTAVVVAITVLAAGQDERYLSWAVFAALIIVGVENLEDRLAYLDEQTETFDERGLSFRLLRHYASSVRHQKYHGLDVVTVRVAR